MQQLIIAGVISVFTPGLLLAAFTTFMIGENFASKFSHHVLNMLIVCAVAPIALLFAMESFVVSGSMTDPQITDRLIELNWVKVGFVCFWLCIVAGKIQLAVSSVFSWLTRIIGMVLLGVLLGISAVGSAGPIIGSLMVMNETSFADSIIPYGISMSATVFVIVASSGLAYSLLRNKKGWKIAQYAIGTLMILGAFGSIYSMVMP